MWKTERRKERKEEIEQKKEPTERNITSCFVEELHQYNKEEMDLSPLNDYAVENGDEGCTTIPKADQIDDINMFSGTNDTEQDSSTYFVPQTDDVPFAAGESENFYPKDDDDDDL
ncbi:unnamed protein product [Acanthoscelides obtectus]|uniref:Uncharacterized protein n=1 Tax=Acanthoscelides obtectus TaxID=200917 RepID=A0A9P0LIX1_ACAOB|nr:unnamed protein product [Acanthoscelides obtectus]CAK1649078.1 hypothetical protein AOBTE_LOCUS16023 [Acanthoscelides obtectus]